MRRKRLVQYLSTLAVLVILRIADLGVTFLYTPNLQAEWNPVVSHFDAAWVGLILVQVLIVGVIAVSMYFYFMREEIRVPVAGLSYNQFVYYYFFGKVERGMRKLFNAPKNLKGILAYNGFVLMFAALSVSVFAVIHNLMLLREVRWYATFVYLHHTVYFVSVIVGAALVGTHWFFIRAYVDYKRMHRMNVGECMPRSSNNQA